MEELKRLERIRQYCGEREDAARIRHRWDFAGMWELAEKEMCRRILKAVREL